MAVKTGRARKVRAKDRAREAVSKVTPLIPNTDDGVAVSLLDSVPIKKAPKGGKVREKKGRSVAAKGTTVTGKHSGLDIQVRADGTPTAKGLPCLFDPDTATITQNAKFYPGNDAKLKSVLNRVVDGAPMSDVPDLARDWMELAPYTCGFRILKGKLVRVDVDGEEVTE